MVRALLTVVSALRSAWLIDLVGAALIVAGVYVLAGLGAALIAAGVALMVKALELSSRGER